MKFCKIMKDGGKESVVWGFFLVEIKSLFSIVILKFEDGSRDAYHNHAFHAFSWVLRGKLKEEHIDKPTNHIFPSWVPFLTKRDCFHKVTSFGNTYALTFRGPWAKTWNEYHPQTDEHITLSDGRKIIT